MPYRACGPFLLALLLGACGEGSRPSAQDNALLDNASEMLDSAPGELETIEGNALEEPSPEEPSGNGVQPAQ